MLNTFWTAPLQVLMVALFFLPAMNAQSTVNQSIPMVDLNPPNVEQLWARAFWHEENTGKTMQGEILDADVDFFEAAHHETNDAEETWKLRIRVENAPALAIYFDAFHIPVGGALRFESAPGRFEIPYTEGPIDFQENNDHGLWASNEIPGEEVWIIYTQPSGVVGTPSLHINGVGFFFRFLWLDGEYDLLAENNRGSDPCQVDVMCPEGDDWACARDATVRLRISMGGGIFLCSGAMVNNTAQDCKQLLLSSFHCADDMAESDWALLKVRYNYEYFDCNGTSSFNSHVRTGVFYITASNDVFGNNINGSDFLLMEVEDPIFTDWVPYYAGWDVSGLSPVNGVGIHHPSGDRKKISTFTSTATNSNVYHPLAHWRVFWVETETDHGVTEGGSSGSPLFDQNKRIVGTLTGGSSFCDNQSAPDYYGKMSYHWDGNNPISEEEKLYNFLDPIGTGQEQLDGSYVTEFETPCAGQSVCGIVDIEELWLQENTWSLLPNPAKDLVYLDWSGEIKASEIKLYNQSGQAVAAFDVRGMMRPQIRVADFPAGMYFVTLITQGGASATRKLVIE